MPTAFVSIWRPMSRGVMIDSGWNCTAAIGNVACSIAMMMPSVVVTVHEPLEPEAHPTHRYAPPQADLDGSRELKVLGAAGTPILFGLGAGLGKRLHKF